LSRPKPTRVAVPIEEEEEDGERMRWNDTAVNKFGILKWHVVIKSFCGQGNFRYK
jgi:hypothetical protein